MQNCFHSRAVFKRQKPEIYSGLCWFKVDTHRSRTETRARAYKLWLRLDVRQTPIVALAATASIGRAIGVNIGVSARSHGEGIVTIRARDRLRSDTLDEAAVSVIVFGQDIPGSERGSKALSKRRRRDDGQQARNDKKLFHFTSPVIETLFLHEIPFHSSSGRNDLGDTGEIKAGASFAIKLVFSILNSHLKIRSVRRNFDALYTANSATGQSSRINQLWHMDP
jgi:hypothetical protein